MYSPQLLVLPYISLCFLLISVLGAIMESILVKCGITNIPSNAPSSDIVRGLNDVDLTWLKVIREHLFCACKERNLTDHRDLLVTHKDTVANPIRKKIVDDILCMDRCIKNHAVIPRTLLKGGKKSALDFEITRSKNSQPLVPPAASGADELSSSASQNSSVQSSSLADSDSSTLHSSGVGYSPSPAFTLIVQRINSLQGEIDVINRRLTAIHSGLDSRNTSVIATLSREVEMLRTEVQNLQRLNTYLVVVSNDDSQSTICPSLPMSIFTYVQVNYYWISIRTKGGYLELSGP